MKLIKSSAKDNHLQEIRIIIFAQEPEGDSRMSYSSARNEAQAASNAGPQDAIKHLAEAIRLLSRAIENDVRQIKSDIDDLERKVR
jgi:hypothetical protein